MTHLVPYVGVWMLLVLFILALALYRRFIAQKEDHYLHISEGEAKLIPHQVEVSHTIQKVDRWGEALTVIALIAGFALGCFILLQRLMNP